MEARTKITIVLAVILILIAGFAYGQDRAINPNQLPKTAKTFIYSNFKGIDIGSAVEDRELYGVDEYNVYLANGIKIEFDRNGNWKEVDGKHQKIPYNFIPSNIRHYVAKNFPHTFITQIKKGRWSYEAELSNGIELEFDKNGNFTKIDD
ncbi:PepSY-like domain-containing protein [Chryseobacterium sp. RG1]|uniref:PepSY-like domain-containing protein n=1 Tax=Chryseobacterium tagetis TaxID=2801334 RepID=A0ABS8A0C6_9FLAO|nr:PepSY-like domain-containing protein [Chryseobacterium tagetis]MCA6067434.1 PepSY-like domain-containing protein [Chryseobacterium tagetis]